jgi:ATP synthase protein I
LLAGGSAALGVAVGALIVGAFFSTSGLFLAWVGRTVPQGLMWAALGAYVIKVVALGIVLVTLPVDGPVDRQWMAGAIALGVLVWLGAQLRYVWTTRIFYVDPR